MVAAVVLGERVAGSAFGSWFVLSRHELTIALGLYGFAASVLPVWMLLTPRDYLSTFMKIGTIGALVVGVIVVNPPLVAPPFSAFTAGGGPIIPGTLFPFVFITIACGAISGFHALIATGTTPKMIDKESDIRPIGYGAMLCEGMVGVMAIVAATALHPGDYYANGHRTSSLRDGGRPERHEDSVRASDPWGWTAVWGGGRLPSWSSPSPSSR
jgi:carbon starvation protein